MFEWFVVVILYVTFHFWVIFIRIRFGKPLSQRVINIYNRHVAYHHTRHFINKSYICSYRWHKTVVVKKIHIFIYTLLCTRSLILISYRNYSRKQANIRIFYTKQKSSFPCMGRRHDAKMLTNVFRLSPLAYLE